MKHIEVEVGIEENEWSYERHYEGKVIQLLSNLRATLLGKELVGKGGKAPSCRILPILYNH